MTQSDPWTTPWTLTCPADHHIALNLRRVLDHAVRMLEGLVPDGIPSLARAVRARLTAALSDLDESIASYEGRFPPVRITSDEQRQHIEQFRDRLSAALLAEFVEVHPYDDEELKQAFIASIGGVVAALNTEMAAYDRAKGDTPR